jgi:Tol biopolymer transport system component
MKTRDVYTFLAPVIFLGLCSLPALAFEDPIQVTTGGGTEPSISPDGNWMLYVSSGAGICRMQTGGGQIDTLGISGSEPDWAPSGDAFLYRHGGLFVYDFAYETSSLLHSGSGWDDGPVWSPLGREIAVQGEPVKLISYPGGELSTVDCEEPDGSSCAGEFPCWSPDGQWIAFQDGREILKVRREGGLAEIVVANMNPATEPAWSPDGKWIVFVMIGVYPQYHLWVADARGTDFGLAQLTSGDFQDWSPDWSPDSGSIYFSSDRSGTREIWEIPFDAQVPTERTSLGGVKALFR